MAAPDPESRACAWYTPRRLPGRLPCGHVSPAQPPPGPMRRRSSRVTWCPWREDRPATMSGQAATDCGGWRAGHNGGDAAPNAWAALTADHGEGARRPAPNRESPRWSRLRRLTAPQLKMRLLV